MIHLEQELTRRLDTVPSIERVLHVGYYLQR